MKPDEVWPPPIGLTGETGVAPDGRPKVGLLLSIIGTGVLLSVVLGALTNAVDAAVCPDYFNVVLFDTVGPPDIWRASVIEGMQEAGVLGLFVSVAFAVGAGIVCRSRLSYKTAVRSLTVIVAGAFVSWVAGGLLAVGFAALRPALFDRAFHLPGGAYAWVGGSIDGGEVGGLLSLVVVLVRLHIRRRMSATAGATAA